MDIARLGVDDLAFEFVVLVFVILVMLVLVMLPLLVSRRVMLELWCLKHDLGSDVSSVEKASVVM
jgi:hypothetical protein